MPQREAMIRQWLGDCCDLGEYHMTLASGDASFRRYFRVSLPEGGSRIVMDAPPGREDCRPFVDVTSRLERVGVHVPHIHAMDLQQGFLMLEDLGERLYQGELRPAVADALYGDAIQALLKIQSGESDGLPHYDRELLEREMGLFRDWLLGVHLGIELDDAESRMLDESFERLVRNALEQPRVLVHRDYHSRNLLVTGHNSPGVIDYQDAVLGPISYDLVSLLRDCYIAWPLEQVDRWRDAYTRQAIARGILDPAVAGRMPEWFDLMGVQRHLKAAGIFARLNHRDGKPGYMADIPRTLTYIAAVARRRPELSGLAGLIRARVMPRLEAA